MSANVGDVIDERYELRALVGVGGTASVYRADDLELGRTVAIKLFGPESQVSDAGRRSTEARMLAQLRHPAIVALFDARLSGTAPYLVLEFVEGETLAQRLARGPIAAAEARSLAQATASGLAAAHRVGIVHRDVKPANILIPRSPDPAAARLLDFGIAHSLGAERLTSAGSFVGSPIYLSPEQARGEEVTAATDVYSLGLVLIELLTGEPAFRGSRDEAVVVRLVRPPDLSHPALATHVGILAGMTALEPADRPSSDEVAQALATDVPTLLLPAPSGADVATAQLRSDDLPTPSDATTARLDPRATPAIDPADATAARLAPTRSRRTVVVVGGLAAAGILVAAGLAGAYSGAPEPSPTPTDVASTPEPVVPADPVVPAEDPGNGNPGNPGNGNDKDKGKKP